MCLNQFIVDRLLVLFIFLSLDLIFVRYITNKHSPLHTKSIAREGYRLSIRYTIHQKSDILSMIVCGQFKLLKESLNGLIHYRLIQFVKIFRKKYRDIAAYISKVLVFVLHV